MVIDPVFEFRTQYDCHRCGIGNAGVRGAKKLKFHRIPGKGETEFQFKDHAASLAGRDLEKPMCAVGSRGGVTDKAMAVHFA